jgi:hypothetical protein
MPGMAEHLTPQERVTALLAYVARTRNVEVGGAAARVRLSAADAALALANDTGAAADVVTACVQAVKDASATYYAAGDPTVPRAFDDVLQDMIDKARGRDADRSRTPDQPEAEAI